VLAGAFVQEFAARYGRPVRGIDDAALRKLAEHSWPGNVRELRNCVERAVIACTQEQVTADLVAYESQAAWPGSDPGIVALPLGTTVEEAERQLIFRTLQCVSNNKTRAARILRISLKTLHNKLNRYASQGLCCPGR
jgi:DNA-binding NtrC family response regulator